MLVSEARLGAQVSAALRAFAKAEGREVEGRAEALRDALGVSGLARLGEALREALRAADRENLEALREAMGGERGPCFQYGPEAYGEAATVTLYQEGVDRFRVTYGRQRQGRLTYGEAAKKLGEAIMHDLACEGLLVNRERGERR